MDVPALLDVLLRLSGVIRPAAQLLQRVLGRGEAYEMKILRFNEHLHRHFGGYFYAVCTAERRYLDVKSRNSRIGLSRVFDALSLERGPRVVVMWGEGGMGKTALAAHIVRTAYVANRWFNVLLGGSAKQRVFIDGEVRTYDDAVLSYSSLLDLMGAQVGVSNIRKTHSAAEKVGFLQRRLRNQRALVVVDNLETLADTQEIVDGMARLVASTRGSRVLVTTRDGRVTGRDLLPIHLSPMTTEEALRFSEWYIDIRGLREHPAIEFAADLLRRVVDSAGGSPLAVEQLLSQISLVGAAAIGSMQEVGGDWREFYDFLFSNALSRTSFEARRLLWLAAGLHRPATYGDFRELAEQEDFIPELDRAIRTLVQLDLLRVGQVLPETGRTVPCREGLGAPLYSPSPLLANYILRHRPAFVF